jgi:hypothetical protein
MNNKPLDRLDAITLHGLMRAIMSANFEDAMDAKSSVTEGYGWSPDDSRAKALEQSLCTLFQCVDKSMANGTLTPFKGDYIKWLEDLGLISPNTKQGIGNAQQKQ